MIKHYLITAVRQMRKSALFSAINLLGFVLGMAAAFLIYLWVVNELTFDDCFPDVQRIYRAVEVQQSPGGELTESASTLFPLAQTLKEHFPQVEEATVVKYESSHSFDTEAGKSITGEQWYADPAFFSLFPFPTVEGSTEQFALTPDNIVLSEPMARKLFGDAPAVGQQVIRSGYGTKKISTVVAVVRIPAKSHLTFDVLYPVAAYPHWGSQGANKFRENISAYVKMRAGDTGRMSAADRRAMSGALSLLGNHTRMLRFQPVNDIYLHTTFADPCIKRHGNMATIYLFVALGIVIIFMGAFNFTTLSTARASLRYKEIGARKVNNAGRRRLIVQFLSESLVQAFIALICSLAVVELTLPLFNRLMDTEIAMQFGWSFFCYILFGIVGVGCLAGSYPAFYLSGINPLIAFKGGVKTGRKGTLIKALVCVQFVFAIVLMLMTGIVFKQLHYMKHKDLGLDKANIISLYTSLWYDVADFKREILRNPDVLSVSMGAPIENYNEGTSNKDGSLTTWTTSEGRTDSVKMVTIWADPDFVKTFGLTLVRGQLMETDFNQYWQTVEHPIVINEAAWKAMKVADPVGMELRARYPSRMRIVGVVKDFNFQSLHEQIKPAYLVYNPESLGTMHIKLAPEHKQETLKFIREKFTEMSGDLFVKEFKYQFFSDALNKNYERESRQSGMLLFFTVLAVLIAVMGVFGLVSLSTEQRTKEIAIRKVNGAHARHIVRLFYREYLRWVGIAFVIACPLGYLLMRNWLTDFAYRTPISWWFFGLAGVVTVLIVVITVTAQTWHKARANPADFLKFD
ncbi:MAG: ABC transporter permease [Prevotellaceae bacterium]|jgi:putative ABC transport system permease protein|nr:ABC transporter permease [Prevotellaceae bacterium]